MSQPVIYNIELSNEKSIEVSIGLDGQMTVGGKKMSPDAVETGKRSWNLLLDNKSYNIQLVSFDGDSKEMVLDKNGEEFSLKVKDALDGLLMKMGMSGPGSSKMTNVKAPMPGLVLKVIATVGQEVNEGDPLIILEAMKMENIIKATGTGVVGKILVNNQDTVDKNQVIIEMQ